MASLLIHWTSSLECCSCSFETSIPEKAFAMAPNWCMRGPSTTKSWSAKFLELTELSWFPASWCSQRLESTHLNGQGGSSPWNQRSRWQWTNRKVNIEKFRLGFLIKYFVPGQTLKEVGLWLRTPAFTHGQLYVACSRVGKPGSLKFALKKERNGNIEKAANIVFKEVLLSN